MGKGHRIFVELKYVRKMLAEGANLQLVARPAALLPL